MLESSNMLRARLASSPVAMTHRDILVELVDEGRLYHLGLLSCSCSPDSWVSGIARVASFRAIGIHCAASVAIGAAINGRRPRGPGGSRCDFHCAGGVWT